MPLTSLTISIQQSLKKGDVTYSPFNRSEKLFDKIQMVARFLYSTVVVNDILRVQVVFRYSPASLINSDGKKMAGNF